MKKLNESRDDASLNDPLNLLVGSVSYVAEGPTSVTNKGKTDIEMRFFTHSQVVPMMLIIGTWIPSKQTSKFRRRLGARVERGREDIF